MRIVPYEDENGWPRQGIIRNSDPDTMAPHGIPLNPPDLSQLVCEEMLKEIYELLMQRELYTWQDVIKAQTAVTSIVTAVVKRRVIAMYKHTEEKS